MLENAKRRGTKTGNPIGRPRKDVDIGRILMWKQRGLGVRRIARKLGVSPTTVQRAIDAHQRVSKGPKTRLERIVAWLETKNKRHNQDEFNAVLWKSASTRLLGNTH